MMPCDMSSPAITKQSEMHRSLVDPFEERDPDLARPNSKFQIRNKNSKYDCCINLGFKLSACILALYSSGTCVVGFALFSSGLREDFYDTTL